jgi:hypothetical protein
VSLQGRIEALDVSLFDEIEIGATLNDRKSLLALHQACAEQVGSFAYLEIGSHLGGSLQVLVQDKRCERIISIDLRPPVTPDERGRAWPYPDNTTARMREFLAALPKADLSKLETIDASTEQIEPEQVGVRPALCFVDGEHTDEAVVRDARFCQRVLGDGGWLAFHDAGIVYRGLGTYLSELEKKGVEHRVYFLPDSMLVVELGERRLPQTPQVLEQILDNAQGYLKTLHENDVYRELLRHRGVLGVLTVAAAFYERVRHPRTKPNVG